MSESREEQLEEANKHLQQEVRLLKQKIDLLIQRMHGKSSEKIAPDQLDFLLNNVDELGKPNGDDSQKTEEVVAKAKKPRRKRQKPRLPEHLPVESREELLPQAFVDHPEQWCLCTPMQSSVHVILFLRLLMGKILPKTVVAR